MPNADAASPSSEIVVAEELKPAPRASIATQRESSPSQRGSRRDSQAPTPPTCSDWAYRKFSLVAAVAAFLWNVASPIKSWVLTSYELIANENIQTKDMEWTQSLDAQFVESLYSQARVALDYPGQAKRFVNVYIDFMVQPMSLNWAPYVNARHNDPSIGRYCRSGLRPKHEKQLAALALYDHTKFELWGRNIRDVIPDQANCNVIEVAEAMMCIKGINASGIVNLEWSTGIPPTDPKLAPGLQIWQDLLMPDLENCLARRRQLMSDSSLNDHPLNVLTQEIASNYSLDPNGLAGKANLYAEVQVQEGFVDMSGNLSGVRRARLSGEITEAVSFAPPIATTPTREAMWTCAFLANESLVSECFRTKSLQISAFFLGHYRVEGNSDRYVESRLTDDGTPWGNLTMFEYLDVPRAHTLPAHQYVNESNYYVTGDIQERYTETFVRPLLAATLEAQVSSDVLDDVFTTTSVCIADQRCAHQCSTSVVTGDENSEPVWQLAYRRSQGCMIETIDLALINTAGYVSGDCFGASHLQDVGAIRLVVPPSVLTRNGLQEWQLMINGTADPNAVLACMLGGRVPQLGEIFPTFFFDLIKPGPRTVLVSVFSRGSEQTLLNYFALASLAGCTVFAVWTVQHTIQICRLVVTARKAGLESTMMDQLVCAVADVNLSTRVWRHRRSYMTLFGFVSLISWYIGFTGTGCDWKTETRAQSGPNATVYEYVCTPGDIYGAFQSAREVARLFAYSHVFYSIVFQPRTLGIERSVRGIAACILFLGIVPNVVTCMLISQLNAWRLQSRVLFSIHNYVALLLLWLVALLIWYRFLSGPYTNFAFKLFAELGFLRQPILKHTVAHHLAGDYYFGAKIQDGPSEWLPLSVALECANIRETHVDLKQRIYRIDDHPHPLYAPASQRNSAVAPATDPSQPPESNDDGPAESWPAPVLRSTMRTENEFLVCCGTTVKVLEVTSPEGIEQAEQSRGADLEPT